MYTLEKFQVPLARLALFVVYFWFGALKFFNLSPAGQMVHDLFDKTVPFLTFPTFYLIFAIFEMVIGILFLVKGWEKVGILLVFVHLIMTALPLFLLPDAAWVKMLVPTLEGQYIIKNLLIAAAAVTVGARAR